jgi:hypothetical protein
MACDGQLVRRGQWNQLAGAPEGDVSALLDREGKKLADLCQAIT